MAIPTEPIGSIPRPPELIAAQSTWGATTILRSNRFTTRRPAELVATLGAIAREVRSR